MIARLYDRGMVRRLKSAAKARGRQWGIKVGARWWNPGRSIGNNLWVIWLIAVAGRAIANNAANSLVWDKDLLASASMLFIGLSLSLAKRLSRLLTIGEERQVLWFYPMSNRDFFRWTAWHFLVRTTGITIIAGAIYFVAANTRAWYGVGIAAIAEWCIVLCIALAITRHVDKLPRWLPTTLYFIAGLMFFVPNAYQESTGYFVFVLPTGWPGVLLTAHWTNQMALVIIEGATLVLGICCCLLLRHLEREFVGHELPEPMNTDELEEHRQDAIAGYAIKEEQTDERILDELESEVTGEATLPLQTNWRIQKLQNWSDAANKLVSQAKGFSRWNWNAMAPIERAVGWCLDDHEKGTAQFLLGPVAPSWSTRWRTAAIATAIGVAASSAPKGGLDTVSLMAFTVSVCVGLPILGGLWPATTQGRISGRFSPIFGCYPLSYWEAGWVIYKANVIRTVAWSPLGILAAVLTAGSRHTNFGHSCWLVVRGMLLFVSILPLLSAAKFSKVTNDTANFRWRIMPLVGLAIFLLAAIGISGIFVLETDGGWPYVLLAGTSAMCWAGWAGYGLYFERGQVDLLREKID